MALRLTFDKMPVEVDPLSDQSSDYLNNVIDPHTDFRQARSNDNRDNVNEECIASNNNEMFSKSSVLDEVVRKDNMLNGAKVNILVDESGKSTPLELDNQLFSYESPANSSYPTISFPVAYFMNRNCPNIVDKVNLTLLESRSNTPTSSLKSSESTDSSLNPPSPLKSMAVSSQGFALQQSYIGTRPSTVPKPNQTKTSNNVNSSSMVQINKVTIQKENNLQIKDVASSNKDTLNSSTNSDKTQSNCKEVKRVNSIDSASSSSSLSSLSSNRKNFLLLTDKSHLAGTHKSTTLREDILDNLEIERNRKAKSNTSDIWSSNYSQAKANSFDTLSNFSDAFETESNFSNMSGIEDEMFQVKQMLVKVPNEAYPYANYGQQNSYPVKVTAKPMQHRETQTISTPRTQEEEIVKVEPETKPNAESEERKVHFEVLRQKTNLEEQVNALKIELECVTKDKLKLQASVSSMEAQISSLQNSVDSSSREKDDLGKELKSLTKEYHQWRDVLGEYQSVIDSKVNEIKSLKEDLAASEIQADKLSVSLEENKVDLEAKDGAIQGLKRKIAELHVESQTLLNDKIQLQNDISSLKSEKLTVEKSKDWYIGQLHASQESKNDLHRELINLQSEYAKAFVLIEQSRSEITRLNRELHDSKAKTVKEKEMLMKHLENIEADMLEREALFIQIEKDKGNAEELIDMRMKKIEEEQTKMTNLKLKVSELEYSSNLHAKEKSDIEKNCRALESDNGSLSTQLVLLKQKLTEQDIQNNKLSEEKINYEKMIALLEMQLKRESQALSEMKREKTNKEIALSAVNSEKQEVNEALKIVQENLSSLENNFKQMRTELLNKGARLEHLTNENVKLEESLQLLEKQLLHQKLAFQEQSSKYSQNSDIHIDDLNKQISELNKVIHSLKKELRRVEHDNLKFSEDNETLMAKLKDKGVKAPSGNASTQTIDVDTPEKMRDRVKNYEPEVYKLQSMMETNEALYKNKIRAYESNIKVLTRKLKEVMKESKRKSFLLATNPASESSGQLSFSNCSVAVQTEIRMIDEESSLTDVEKMMQKYKDQVEYLEKVVANPCLNCQEKDKITEDIQKTILNLEKENGQLRGTAGGFDSVKLQVEYLENSLAERDAKVASVEKHLDELLKQKEKSVSELEDKNKIVEDSLSKEKSVAKDLRYQIFQEKREVKQLKHQISTMHTKLDQSSHEIDNLKLALQHSRDELEKCLEEKLRIQGDLLHQQNIVKQNTLQIKLLGDELKDVQGRDPALAEQMKALSWHLKEKNQELTCLKKQLEVVEDRCKNEKENMNKQIRLTEEEVNNLKEELNSVRKEKFALQSSVSELKGALRSSISIAKNLRSQLVENNLTASKTGLSVQLPESPAPYDESFINNLLKQSMAKPECRPLSNLQACLNSLKQEMSVLQTEIEKRSKV